METALENLSFCPHYDDIVNFPIKEEDYVSTILINDYQDFLFKKDNVIPHEQLTEYDTLLYEYITNSDFHRFASEKYNREPTFESDHYTFLKETLEEFKRCQLTDITSSKWL